MNKNKKYKKYFKSTKWKQKREELFMVRGKKCEKCGSTENIHVHHKTYRTIYNEKLEHLEVLCSDCHGKEHDKIALENKIYFARKDPNKKVYKRNGRIIIKSV